ncbi:hypothetical protein C1646_777758 [Rhizophagus diaphanus]|nr:hypothetical protein C1646_777758 [Rhizophagus diaphanus] [Rhizophagus sp. MUCL 43196]
MNRIIETCHELSITIVTYGKYRSIDDFDLNDIRRNHSRFQAKNFAKNLEFADKFIKFASKKGLTSS